MFGPITVKLKIPISGTSGLMSYPYIQFLAHCLNRYLLYFILDHYLPGFVHHNPLNKLWQWLLYLGSQTLMLFFIKLDILISKPIV